MCPDPEGKRAAVSWALSSLAGAGHLSSRSSKEEGTQGCEKDREEIMFGVSISISIIFVLSFEPSLLC